LNVIIHDRQDQSPAARAWVGYRVCLSQVVLNLLTNIQRYAYPEGAGGDVEIIVAADGPQLSPYFVVSVRDFGRSIQAADLSRVFEPFFTTGRQKGGTGLGLAIVRNLVADGLQGSVELTSRPDEGTVVTLRLPARCNRLGGDDLEYGITPGSGDERLRRRIGGQIECEPAAGHLLDKVANDRRALVQRDLYDADPLNPRAFGQPTPAAGTQVPDPVGVGERRDQPAFAVMRQRRDRRRPELATDSAGHSQEVDRPHLLGQVWVGFEGRVQREYGLGQQLSLHMATVTVPIVSRVLKTDRMDRGCLNAYLSWPLLLFTCPAIAAHRGAVMGSTQSSSFASSVRHSA
jgi:anti-sigma regulatory factor (Ser/Thr protein kinase)